MKNKAEQTILSCLGTMALQRFQKMMRDEDYPEPEEIRELEAGRVPPSLARRLAPEREVSQEVRPPYERFMASKAVKQTLPDSKADVTVSKENFTVVMDVSVKQTLPWSFEGKTYAQARQEWELAWAAHVRKMKGGMTVSELEEALGVSRPTVLRWLKG